MKRIEDHYRANAVRIKGSETIRIKLKRLVKSCKDFVAKRKVCRGSNTERRKQENFHQVIHGVFDVADTSSNARHRFSESSSSQDLDTDTSSSFDGHDSNDELDSIDSDPADDDLDPGGDDSDPDYDPSKDSHCPNEKMPIPDTLLREANQSRGSYRLSEKLLNIGVKIGGGNPKAFGLSKSTLWSKMVRLRSSQTNELLASLASSTCKIVVQFDGKQCTKLNARHLGKEERFIVICHTIQGDIPLGFFILSSKSGRECASQILKPLAEYNLLNRVVGFVSDTESTNTGRDNGTCALIELSLNEDLLYLMCRHHIKEIQLRDVFIAVFGQSQSSHLTTFNMLIENWHHIKSTGFNYSPIGIGQLRRTALIRRMTKNAIDLITLHSQSKNVRDDYAELNDLVLKIFGVETATQFRVVGARNNARWMARIIYAMKTYLFREHLNLDVDFLDSLERFCIFVALVYAKHWNVCSNVVDAPYYDIQLLKELDDYAEIGDEIANVAIAAHERHLWYLSDELIALSLFSEKVSVDEKIDMVAQMTRQAGERTENSIKHTAEIDDIKNLQLHHFISGRSFFIFERLQLDAEFLNENPEDWNRLRSYKHAKKTILGLLTVVNDSAERALQLGAITITNQRVQSESRLQDFIISTYGKENSIHTIN